MPHEQLSFLASLDFPGRTTLTVAEIAEKLGYTAKHIARLIESGELPALDGRGRGVGRAAMRVPVESYRTFVTARMTGPLRAELLHALPEATRLALILELFAGLPAAARPAVLRDLRQSLAA
jgi:excisionase family DNA binding protein